MWSSLSNLLRALDEAFQFKHKLWVRSGTTEKDLDTIRSIINLFHIREHHHCAETGSLQPNSATLTLVSCTVSLARNRLCVDERDRVYGMLAIASGHIVHPDYLLSAEDLFFDVAKQSLQQGDFSVLHEHNSEDFARSTPLLFAAFEPSNGKYSHVWRTVSKNPFQASTGQVVQVSVLDANEIKISGLIVDKISQSMPLKWENDVLDPWRVNVARKADCIRELSLEWYQVQCETACHPYEHEGLFHVISRSMAADSYHVQDADWPVDEQRKLWQRSLFKTTQG